ncbi:hypothetical protein G3580_06260 [Nitrogeniibacter mangrovi]|uniref:Uncharacterized protein n=1 Tax=Nitrogeniibacter mangrovi TaxID=2016596 RepID=A0A6C1B347_9RHOO|nr:hypothetical protein [Nitrogeniibacter mangrovi]QID17285.1 hypothetical protein G3580_06260 [Nitrogeniibacter mangrovi]
MPFPWAAAAKAIPWTDVISAAPTLAKGARDLWKRMRTDPKPEDTPDDAEAAASPEARLDALTRVVLTMEQRNEAQTELITRLAEQQEQLVTALDRARRRARLALVLAGLATALAAWGLLGG